MNDIQAVADRKYTGIGLFRGKKYRWQLCFRGRRSSGICDTLNDAITAREKQLEIERHNDMLNNSGIQQANGKQQQRAESKTGITLKEAVAAMWQADWSNAKSADSINRNSKIVMSYFGENKPLADITRDDVDGFIDHLRQVGNARPTINRKLAIISKLLNRAHERGQIEKMPFIQRQQESKGRIHYITPEEEKQILNMLQKWKMLRFYSVVIVLLDTGIRCGELKRLSPRDIQPGQGRNGIIYLNDTKNGTDRSVPLTARAAAALHYLVQTSVDHDRVISEYKGWITKSWNRVRHYMNRSKDQDFVPHILRHTCCTRLVQRGAPIAKVQLWMGHKSIQTTLRYTHLNANDIDDLSGLLER